MRIFQKLSGSSIVNLRPYSWVDVVLVGLLAKTTAVGGVSFGLVDASAFSGLLALWFFFQLALEHKHDYQYRPKAKLAHALFFLFFAAVAGFMVNPATLFFSLGSAVLIALYLLKNSNPTLALLSCVFRGGIQAAFFFYVCLAYSPGFSPAEAIAGVAILLLYTARAVIGDLRDLRHNAQAKKRTIPVEFGQSATKWLSIALIAGGAIALARFSGNLEVPIPLALFVLAVLFYPDYYVLHQLMVLTTSFSALNAIASLAGQSLFLFNLAYAGVCLNLVFYPMLSRKSNPTSN